MVQLLKNRNFFLVWFGQLISQLGDKVYSIALMWYVLEKTGSAADMGLVMMVSAIPAVVFGPFCGVLADRWNRKWILVITDALRGSIVCGLSWLMHTDSLSLKMIYGAIFVLSALGTLFNPSIISLIPSIVKEDDLQQAMSMNQMTRDISAIAGSVGGGMLVAFVSVPAAFLFNGVSFLFSAVCELPIQAPEGSGGSGNMAHELKEGFLFVRSRPVLLNMLVSFGVLNFFGVPLLILMPVIVKKILCADASYLGYLELGMGAGSLAGALLMGYIQLPKKKHNFIFGVFLLTAAQFVLFAFTSSFAVFFGSILLVGGFLSMVNISLTVSFQQLVEDSFKGRFFAILEMICTAAFPLSFGLFGWLAEKTALEHTFLICAAGIFLSAVYFRSIRGIENI